MINEEKAETKKILKSSKLFKFQALLLFSNGIDASSFELILYNRFPDVPHKPIKSENDYKTVYYQVLLNVPRSEEIFGVELISEVGN